MNLQRLLLIIVCLGLIATGVALNWHSFSGREPVRLVDFNRDIRPILNQNCTSCHGGVKQAGDVSFIYREEALGKGKSGRPTVVPGRPHASELIARVISRDPAVRMPLHGEPLSTKQVDLMRQWIKEGAEWENYWAFVPPKPQALPAVTQKEWLRQPLDHFVLAKLEKEGLKPSPETDKAALLRRVSLDLTGLPPTPEELSTFLADTSPQAYEKQVDRLLASPHYGEHWASMWLDLARYADSHPLQSSSPYRETVWPYRDWVIDAFNRNMPYDRFVITQLAGDLFPNPTSEDLIATAFQRFSFSLQAEVEEARIGRIMDRSATTWLVLNGVTMNCVQCHSHPYDPLRHKEYYQFLAFYNTSRDANHHPVDVISTYPALPVAVQTSRRSEVASLEARRTRLITEIVQAGHALDESTRWMPLPFKSGEVQEIAALKQYLAELKYRRDNPPPEEIADKNVKAFQKTIDATIGLTNTILARTQKAPTTAPLKVEQGEVRETGTIPAQSAYLLATGALPAELTALRIEAPPEDPNTARHSPERGFKVDRIDAWTVDKSGAERPIRIRYYVPDSEEDLDNLMKNPGPSGEPIGAFAASPTQTHTRWMILIPETPLRAEPGMHLKLQVLHTQGIRAQPAAHLRRVRAAVSDDPRWTALGNDRELTAKRSELTALSRQLLQIPIATVPIMREQPDYDRRDTLVFERGSYLTKVGNALTPDTPGIFPKLPDNAPRNRLTMANWFFSPDQPLTARVAVNRYWERLFGAGIVELVEDFGSATGQAPSHPELLDWLALHFQNDLHWDIKRLLREIVLSATYRQIATVTPELQQKDPGNRLLARGPQQRLTAEMVRDQALLASGLLNPAMGGMPVMPPQPTQLDLTWKEAKNSDRYRRSIYVLVKRSNGFPGLTTFDASLRTVSLARRTPTNTPLQALVTLNEPVFYEATQALGRHMSNCARTSQTVKHQELGELVGLAACLNDGAKRVLSRDLSAEDLATFMKLYNELRSEPGKNRELAAFTTVAATFLNLDAALTR